MVHPTVSCLGVVVAGGLLACCAQFEAQQQAQANAQVQAQAASDDAPCRSYGVMPGSPGYVQCRMNLDNQHAAAFNNGKPYSALIFLVIASEQNRRGSLPKLVRLQSLECGERTNSI
jgi:hypothetical protein